MATWTNDTKSSTTTTNIGRTGQTRWDDAFVDWDSSTGVWDGLSTVWANLTQGEENTLLQESGYVLLLENGSSILLETSGSTSWTNQTKN